MIVTKEETKNGAIWYVTNENYAYFKDDLEMLVWCTAQFGNIDRLVEIRHFNKGWNYHYDKFVFRREEDVTMFLLRWSNVS